MNNREGGVDPEVDQPSAGSQNTSRFVNDGCEVVDIGVDEGNHDHRNRDVREG
jgi:hypothetical protein